MDETSTDDDLSSLALVFEYAGGTLYEAEPGLLVFAPSGAPDDLESARIQLEAVHEYSRGQPHPVVGVILGDRVGPQTPEARVAYQRETDPELTGGIVFVGMKPLTRQLVGAILKLRPTSIPLSLAGTLPEGLSLARQRLEEVRRAGEPAPLPEEHPARGKRLVFSTTVQDAYELEPGLLFVLPRPGTRDTAETATVTTALTTTYLESLPHRGIVVVHFDGVASQDRGAREVHREQSDPKLMAGVVLVGGTPLSRALIAFFSVFNRPSVPLHVFRSVDEALPWCRARLETLRSKEAGAT